MGDTNSNLVPIGYRHFEFFESLDDLLLQQEADNARLHEEVEKNWLDDPLADEAILAWEAFRHRKED